MDALLNVQHHFPVVRVGSRDLFYLVSFVDLLGMGVNVRVQNPLFITSYEVIEPDMDACEREERSAAPTLRFMLRWVSTWGIDQVF